MQNKENRLYEDLKKLRLNIARDYNVPAWKIFNDNQLEKLIQLKPLNIESLINSGIIKSNSCKYFVNDILKLFRYYSDDFENDETFSKKIDLLFDKLNVAENPSYFDEKKHNPKHISLAREIKKGNEFSRTGYFYSEKMQRNIHYESELERQFYLRLEKKDNIKYYFPQPLKVKYNVEYTINEVTHNKRKNYYPDILIIFSDNTECLVEIKNYYHLIYLNSQLKLALCEEIRKKYGIGYLFSTNYQNCLNDAINYPFNKKFFDIFLKAINKKGSVTELNLNRARVSSKIRRQELLPFCYQNSICLEDGEFVKFKINKIEIKELEITNSFKF